MSKSEKMNVLLSKMNGTYKKKQIVINYSITSQKCLKSIVCGCRSFSDDITSIKFIKRLVSVKNALCERSDKDRWNDVVSEQKVYNNRDKKADWHGHDRHEPFNEAGLPYILSYNCKTS